MKHVRLTFNAEVQLTASAGGEPGRLISGLIVPYNVEAELGYMGRLEFAPGSIELAGRVPMLLGHDSNRPVGVLAETIDSDTGLYGTFRIDRTADGDAALAQAASGSRAGLSIGADVIEFEGLEKGELTRVTQAKVSETSLVSLAAFDTAAVDAVAAAKTNRKDGAMEPTTEPTTEETKAAAKAAEDDRIGQAVRAAMAERQTELDAEQRRPAIVVAEKDRPEMRLGEYVQTWIKAEKGDSGARARIEAALTREVVGNEPGVIPIAYSGALVDGLGADRPLRDAFSSAEMPASGMTIRRPHITTRPDGNWLADDTAGAPSNAVVIGNLDVPVVQWAWGGAASVALVERSSPSYIEEVWKQTVLDYYRDAEKAIAAELSKVAAGAETTLGGAVGDYMIATRMYPNVIVAGATAYGKIIDALGLLRYSSGSADATGSANLAGLRVVPSPDVTPADAWITHTAFLETRESTPIRLSVSDVTGLSLQIGTTSFWAIASQLIPGGAVRIAGFVPPADDAGTRSAKK